MRTITPWTEDRVSLLTKLWEEGLTANQIVARFNGAVSRNAIIGKVHRLGIKQPPRHVSPKEPRNKPRKRVLVPPTHQHAINWGLAPRWSVSSHTTRSTIKNTSILHSDFPPIPKPIGIDIMKLNGDTCRAVIGREKSGLASYCGDRVMIGKSFCPGHCAMYYQPPVPRKR